MGERKRGWTVVAAYGMQLVRAAGITVVLSLVSFPLAVAAVKEGADTLLTKPVDADRLLREAEALRDRPRASGGTTVPAGAYNLDEMERETIKAALAQSGGVIANAAKLLGIDRRTLQRKLKRFE